MKQTINLSTFRDAFIRAGLGDRFSCEGLKIIFDYLEELYDGGYELDVIAICGNFTEYKNHAGAFAAYDVPNNDLDALESEAGIIYISDDPNDIIITTLW